MKYIKMISIVFILLITLSSCKGKINDKSSAHLDENSESEMQNDPDSQNPYLINTFRDSLCYYLIPPKESDNPHSLVIAFHGASGAISAMQDYGSPFIKDEAQEALGGAYVLIPVSTDFYLDGTQLYIDLIHEIIDNNSDIDTSRIYVLGHSYGAKFACDLLLKEPELFSAALLSSCFYDMSTDDANALKDISFWFETSTDDDSYFYTRTQKAVELLSASGAEVKYKEFYDRGHVRIDIYEYFDDFKTSALDWMADKVKK